MFVIVCFLQFNHGTKPCDILDVVQRLTVTMLGTFLRFIFFLPLNKGDVTSCENTKSRNSIVIFRCWDIYKEGSKRGMGRGKE